MNIADSKSKNGNLIGRLAAVMLAALLIAVSIPAGFAYAEDEGETTLREVHRVGVGNKAYCFFVTHNVVLTPEEIAKFGSDDEKLTDEVLKRAGLYMKETNCKLAKHKAIGPKEWKKMGGTLSLGPVEMYVSDEEENADDAGNKAAAAKTSEKATAAKTPAKAAATAKTAKQTTVNKTDKGDTAEPTKDGDTAEPATEGDSAEPTDDGDTTEPTDDGDTTEPTDDGDTTEPTDDGDTTEPKDDGDTTEPTDDGDTTEPTDDGDTTEPTDDGDTTEPTDDGDTAEPTDDGDTAEPTKDGDTAEPTKDGDTAEPKDAGDSAEPTNDTEAETSDDTPKGSMTMVEGVEALRMAAPTDGEPVRLYMDIIITTEKPKKGSSEEPTKYSTFKKNSPNSPKLIYVAVATEKDAALGEDICIEKKPKEKPIKPIKIKPEVEQEEMLPEYRTISMTDRSGGPLEPTLKDGDPVTLEWIEPGKLTDSDGSQKGFFDNTWAIPVLAAAAVAAATLLVMVLRKRRNAEED